LLNFYQGPFIAGDTYKVEASLEDMEGRVTEAMDVDLLKPFLVEEVEVTLRQMHPLKS
jgi:hypothetical protein